MNINKLDNTNFGAGNVFLKRTSAEQFPKCYDAIKKLAEDRNMDIFISKNKESKYLPKEDMYIVTASKKFPIFASFFYKPREITKYGTGVAILSKNAEKEKLSVRIYNAVIRAIENLEKKSAGL